MVLVIPWLFKFTAKPTAVGMALWPFIIVRDKKFAKRKKLLFHEKIHLRQQLELLIIPFYLWYVLEYFYHLIRLKDGELAYYAISFEKEAYSNDHNFAYLQNRKCWSFLKYFN